MGGFGQLLAILGGLVVGVSAGLFLGDRVRGRAAWFWGIVVAGFVAGTVVAFIGQVVGQAWVMFLGLGLLGGLLTGLRYGYGQPLGPFKMLDRFTKAENLPETRSDDARGGRDERDERA